MRTHEDGVVVFIGGMYFTQKPFRSKLIRGDSIGFDEDCEIEILDAKYYPLCDVINIQEGIILFC